MHYHLFTHMEGKWYQHRWMGDKYENAHAIALKNGTPYYIALCEINIGACAEQFRAAEDPEPITPTARETNVERLKREVERENEKQLRAQAAMRGEKKYGH